MNQNSEANLLINLKEVLQSIGGAAIAPFKVVADNILESGSTTPRMALSRASSLVKISELEAGNTLLKIALQEWTSESLSVAKPAEFGNDAVTLSSDIIWIILNIVSQNCREAGNCADLACCALVNKRFNRFATVFLWNHLDIKSSSSLVSLTNTLMNQMQKNRLGGLVRGLSLCHISFIENKTWTFLLDSFPLLEFLGVERCHIQENSAPCSEQGTNEMRKLKILVVADCATTTSQPIQQVCEIAGNISKLNVIGCNFNETQMIQLISLTPNLRDIKLGSHAGPSLTAIGSAGGDIFAKNLALKCPLLIGADLTGIISMTDVGWYRLMNELGPQLEKLYVRRAMQISLDSLKLVQNCKNVKRLTIANVPHMTDDVLSSIIGSIGSQLSFLQLESLRISDPSICALAECCLNLVQLRIFQCRDWQNLDLILYSRNLRKLKTLVLHGCEMISMLNCEEAARVYSSNTESLPLPDSSRIRDTSYIPYTTNLHVDNSPITPNPGTVIESSSNECCGVSLNLTHLEIVSCDSLDQQSIKSMIYHWETLKRFIFVGNGLDLSLRKYLKKKKSLKSSIYALTPSTPTFET